MVTDEPVSMLALLTAVLAARAGDAAVSLVSKRSARRRSAWPTELCHPA